MSLTGNGSELSSTLDVAKQLISDLDRNDPAAVGARFAPNATWWVDTGLDRAAGQFDSDPGDDRPWPLHGRMAASGDGAMLLQGLPSNFPDGCRQSVRRAFVSGDLAVVEVAGDGLYLGKRRYQNRHAFVIEVVNGRVLELREYLDTAHAADVFEGRNTERRSAAPQAAVVAVEPRSEAGRMVMRFFERLSAADGVGVQALCGDGATWWADGGLTRTAGPEAPVEVEPLSLASGRVTIERKAGILGRIGGLFPDGLAMRVHRLIEAEDAADSGLVAAEVQGHGKHVSGALYQNRYCFIFGVTAGSIIEVREYGDTLHQADVMSGRAGV